MKHYFLLAVFICAACLDVHSQERQPLAYQLSNYDCGMASMLNAVSYMVPRDKIPPVMIKTIVMTTMDTYDNNGHYGQLGTSRAVMQYLSYLLTKYSEVHQLGVSLTYVGNVTPDSLKRAISLTVANRGCAVCRMYDTAVEDEHYILVTNIKDGNVYAFDPYFATIKEKPVTPVVEDGTAANVSIPADWFFADKGRHCICKPNEAVLWHTSVRK